MAIRYGNHGTVTSLLPFSTAFTIACATSSASITKRRMSPLRSFERCGKPSVSTKPGMTVCTWIPLPCSSAAVEREKASWACLEAEYAPAGAKATVPDDRDEVDDVRVAGGRAQARLERAQAPDAAEVVHRR